MLPDLLSTDVTPHTTTDQSQPREVVTHEDTTTRMDTTKQTATYDELIVSETPNTCVTKLEDPLQKVVTEDL